MRNIICNIFFSAILLFVSGGCSEREALRYGEAPRVVFVSNNGDSYTNFIKNYNFTAMMAEARDDSVSVRIQGLAPAEDMKVFFKMEPIEGSDVPSIELPEEPTVIPAGEYTTKLYFKVRRPTKAAVTYKGNLVVDYQASGLEPGITERSMFEISVWDTFEYEWGEDSYLKCTLEDYNTHLTPLIGPPSRVWVRFLLNYSTLTSYFKNGLPDYVSLAKSNPTTMVGRVTSALEAYNKANADNPLKDENGNIIELP